MTALIISIVASVAETVVAIMLISAICKIVTISNDLKLVLRKLQELGALGVEIDRHRREEFNAINGNRD